MARHYLLTVLLLILLILPRAHAQQVEDVQALMGVGQYRNALLKVNEVITQQTTNDPRPRFLKGQILTHLNRQDDAIAIYIGLTQEFPNLPEPYNNLAMLYMVSGDLDKARLALLNALNTHESYATAYQNLSAVYAEMASRAYRKALETDVQGPQLILAISNELKSWQTPEPAAIAVVAQQTPSSGAANDAANQSTNAVPADQGVLVATANASQSATGENSNSGSSNEQTQANTANDGQDEDNQQSAAAEQVATIAETEDTQAQTSNDKPQDPKTILIKMVNEWASAWSKKDVEGYLSYYSDDFKPEDPELSHQDWVKQRQGRLRWRKFIKVEVSSPKVVVKGNSAEVSFRQSYQSDTYEDQVRKTLSMKRVKDSWKIVREKSSEV